MMNSKEYKKLLSYLRKTHNRNYLSLNLYDEDFEDSDPDKYILILAYDDDKYFLLNTNERLEIIQSLINNHHITRLETPHKHKGSDDDTLAPMKEYYQIEDYDRLISYLQSKVES
jgi:hypothetical protein